MEVEPPFSPSLVIVVSHRMHKSQIFFCLALSFLGGVFVRSFFEVGLAIYFLLVIFSLIILGVFYKNGKAALVAFLFLFFALGLWRTNNSIKTALANNDPGKIENVEAIVVREPDEKDTYKNVVLEFNYDGQEIKALAMVDKNSDIAYGDKVDATCNLEIPQNKDSKFDYRMYLAKDGIGYVCKKAQIEKIAGGGNGVYKCLLSLKNVLQKNIFEAMPVPESALASGMLFGGTSGLSEKVKNNFSKTGLTHIVAVSGFNVTIIAEYLLITGIFFGLWRKQALWAALIGIFLFIAMIGFPSSAVRAGIMGGMLIWAMKHGHIAESANAILFSAAIMLLLNPLLLRYDVGFQLSFLATLGIIMLSPFWEKGFVKKHKALGITEMIVLTISASIFVLPIIMYNFGTLSLISILANVAVLPFVPLAMLLIFLVSLAGILSPYFAMPFAWLAYIINHYIITIVSMLADLSWSSKNVAMSVWMVLIYYIILFGFLWLLKNVKIKKQSILSPYV